MNTLYISGSPRKESNTDHLLKASLRITGGDLLKLKDLEIKPCHSCWACVETGQCVLQDEMTKKIMPLLLDCDCMVLGSPVYFNNVSSILKAFIDRTWCLKGQLKNKIGAAVAVGRGYGIEGAITAMHAFFLKHEIIVANRGVSGFAFEEGEITRDTRAMTSAEQLGRRILELGKLID